MTHTCQFLGHAFPLLCRERVALTGVGIPVSTFRSSNTQPADALCLRFDGGLTTATARLKVRWFAIPFLPDSFIPYCMPVYPGARIQGEGHTGEGANASPS